MIQRKQTIFLLLALIATVVCLCLPLGWIEMKGMGASPILFNLALKDSVGNYEFAYCPLFVFMALASLLSLVTIFMFKNRRMQMRLCQLNLLMVCLWYALFAYYVFVSFKEMGTFHQELAACLPFVSAVFQWLAHRGILADEKLVKAADRIR